MSCAAAGGAPTRERGVANVWRCRHRPSRAALRRFMQSNRFSRKRLISNTNIHKESAGRAPHVEYTAGASSPRAKGTDAKESPGCVMRSGLSRLGQSNVRGFGFGGSGANAACEACETARRRLGGVPAIDVGFVLSDGDERGEAGGAAFAFRARWRGDAAANLKRHSAGVANCVVSTNRRETCSPHGKRRSGARRTGRAWQARWHACRSAHAGLGAPASYFRNRISNPNDGESCAKQNRRRSACFALKLWGG